MPGLVYSWFLVATTEDDQAIPEVNLRVGSFECAEEEAYSHHAAPVLCSSLNSCQ